MIWHDFEGCRLKPYLCSAGVPTIGWGSTRYRDGKKVSISDPAITQLAADELLAWTLDKIYYPGVLRCCPGLSGNRLIAIVDFAYNLGVGNLQCSTLRARINSGKFEDVPGELLRWCRAGGVVSAGLVRRRKAEIELFLT